MKIEITTESNFKEIEDFLKNYEKKIKELGSDKYNIVYSWHRLSKRKYIVNIEKEGLNFLMEKIIKKTFESQLKKINPKIKVD